MDEIREIRVDGMSVGLVGLDAAFRAVRDEGGDDDARRAERLMALVAARNYVPPASRERYAAALLREFKRFVGEPVADEEGESAALEIRVLGPGCPPCDMLMQRTMAVLSELDIRADIRHVTDITAIADYGVVSTPALIIDGIVKSVGSVPPPERIAGWLREATDERGEGED